MQYARFSLTHLIIKSPIDDDIHFQNFINQQSRTLRILEMPVHNVLPVRYGENVQGEAPLTCSEAVAVPNRLLVPLMEQSQLTKIFRGRGNQLRGESCLWLSDPLLERHRQRIIAHKGQIREGLPSFAQFLRLMKPTVTMNQAVSPLKTRTHKYLIFFDSRKRNSFFHSLPFALSTPLC